MSYGNSHNHYGEYAEARHDHRSEYADERHDHDPDYADKFHRHYDLEREDENLKALLQQWENALRELREEFNGALERIRQLEQQAPDARQAEFEADQAAAGGEDQGDGEPDEVRCARSGNGLHTTSWYLCGRCQACGLSGPGPDAYAAGGAR